MMPSPSRPLNDDINVAGSHDVCTCRSLGRASRNMKLSFGWSNASINTLCIDYTTKDFSCSASNASQEFLSDKLS